MTKIYTKMVEPLYAPYIYIDPKKKDVHVLFPVVNGTQELVGTAIGLDNTCDAVHALEIFFGISKNSKSISALSSLSSYKELLEFDIELLKDDLVLKHQKQERLKQVNLYIDFLTKNKAHPIFNPLINTADFPSPLKRLMRHANSNLYSMTLRPVAQDSYLRMPQPVFSLKHRRVEDGTVIEEESLFNNTIIDRFKALPIHRRNYRARLIAAVLADERKEVEFDFERLRKRLSEEISRTFEEVHLTKKDSEGHEKPITKAMIDTWMGQPLESAEDYVNALLRYAIAPNFFDSYEYLESPFNSIQTAADDKGQKSAELLSLLTQFLLGEANIYCVSKRLTKTNFGQILDGDEDLSHKLAERLFVAVPNEQSVEEALLDFVNEHQEKFGLTTALSTSDKEQIIERFRIHYPQIKDTEQFDEFVIVDLKRKGLFVTHQGIICTDLTEFIKAAIDENPALTSWNNYLFQRLNEGFKDIDGALPHQNTLHSEAEAQRTFEVEIETLSDAHLRTLIKHLPLDEQLRVKALPIVQERIALPDLLGHVSHGEQNQADIFLNTFKEQGFDIQTLLLKPCQFTDYSGRIFHCTAFEYAYWCKDFYMCQMLLKHMDDNTKTEMANACGNIKTEGLRYTLNGQPNQSAHFELAPLKKAYQDFFKEYKSKSLDMAAIDKAWINIGKEQRLAPANVGNEYCHPERSFDPTPTFIEEPERCLEIYNWDLNAGGLWFPAESESRGLGFDFAILRGSEEAMALQSATGERDISGDLYQDYEAIQKLDEIRTTQMTKLYQELCQAPGKTPSITARKG